MDLDQPLSTHDPSPPGQASHSSPPYEQLPVINIKNATILTIDNYFKHVHKGRRVLMIVCMHNGVCVCTCARESSSTTCIIHTESYT